MLPSKSLREALCPNMIGKIQDLELKHKIENAANI